MIKIIALPVQAAFITTDSKYVIVYSMNPLDKLYKVLEQDPNPGPNNPRWKDHPLKVGSYQECVEYLQNL